MKSQAIFQIPEENVEQILSATNILNRSSLRKIPVNSPRRHQTLRKLNVFSSAPGKRQTEPEIVQRMVEFMKEQIDITQKKTKSMFQKPLKEQALQIVQLRQLLGQTEKQLQQKEATIKQLLSKLKTVFNSDPIAIAQNCISRLTAIQTETKKLKKMQVSLETYQITLNKKITEVESVDNSKLAAVIKRSEQQLKSLISQQRNGLLQLQKNLQSVKQMKQSNFPQLDFPVYMNNMKTKLAEIYSQLQFQSERSYEYDNYKIPVILSMLTKVQSDLGVLPGVLAERNSLEIDSSTISFNEDGASETESSYDRFRSMARKMRLKLPLPVEIDQTGYMKSIETGMYIADENGDYFQLSEEEIEEFVSQGLVWL